MKFLLSTDKIIFNKLQELFIVIIQHNHFKIKYLGLFQFM